MRRTIDFDETRASASLDAALRDTLDPGPMPAAVQERLNRTYASFSKIPQEIPPKRRRVRRGAVIASIAAACALVSGAAFAATNLLQMGPGDAAFFAADKNLPVFSSMEPGAKALSATVGQTATVDGMNVTLDSISCDRNVANLYLTLSKEGGFDLDELSAYAGSQESEWARLESLMPALSYTVTADDGTICTGEVGRLDAYLEGSDVKCLMRITPEATMTDEVRIDLTAHPQDRPDPVQAFSVGLDMENVPAPLEAGRQSIVFDTTQGAKTLALERFTASSLATVMVVQNQETQWIADDGATASGWPEAYIHPRQVKITDDKGNVLQAVEPGDGQGVSGDDACIIEFAGMDPDAQSVTFTPILTDEATMETARQERAELVRSGQDSDDDEVTVDVSKAGSLIPLTPLGGYEITGWTVENGTVTIMMKPYGWTPDAPELIPERSVTALSEEWSDPATGEAGVGEHTAIMYRKWDYATGELAQIDSYYKATDDELSALHEYVSSVYPDWYYSEDAAAAKTLSLVSR